MLLHRPATRDGVVRAPRLSPLGWFVAAALTAVVGGTALTAANVLAGLSAGPFVTYALPVTRVLMNLGSVLVVGCALVPVLAGRAVRGATVGGVVAASTAAIAALTLLVLQVAELRWQVTVPNVVRYVERVVVGQSLLAVVVLAAGCIGVGAVALRRPGLIPAELRFVLALCAVVPLPLTGHARGSEYSDVTVLTLQAHVLAAAAWTGGLLAVTVLLARLPAVLSVALPRFSSLATIAIAVVVVSGLVNAAVELGTTPDVGLAGFFTTAYGWTSLAKVACAAVVAAIGGTIRTRLLPAVVARRPTAFVGLAALEIGVLGICYGLGTVLSRAAVIA
ncbi:CopD family protein [Saccharothrix sp. S26]|uniref:copper resistance D family protein n=1 Tax=Saccharothrix sp. S26 TaxID=2907215 RepID=UPI001F19FDB2|nr:CopD family protein [Saccharothrix sp. S26]MCE6993948.1 CopD family protein [Saccharothrix sp. S26]